MMSDGDPPMDPSGNHVPTDPDIVDSDAPNKDEAQEAEEARPESDIGNSDYISLSSNENPHSHMTSPADSDAEFIDAQENVEKEKCIDIFVKKSPNSHTFIQDVLEECFEMVDNFMEMKENEVNKRENDTSQKENKKNFENKQSEEHGQTSQEIQGGSNDKKVRSDSEEKFQLDMEKDGYQLGGTLSLTTVIEEKGFTILGNEEETENLEVKDVKIPESSIDIKEIVSKLEVPPNIEKSVNLKINTNEVAENITKNIFDKIVRKESNNGTPVCEKSASRANIFEKSERLFRELNTLSTFKLDVPNLESFMKTENEDPHELESNEIEIKAKKEPNENPPEIDSSELEPEVVAEQEVSDNEPLELNISVKDRLKMYEIAKETTSSLEKDSISKTPSEKFQEIDSLEQKTTENVGIEQEDNSELLEKDSDKPDGMFLHEKSQEIDSLGEKMTEKVGIEQEEKTELREKDLDKPAEMLPHEKSQEMDSLGQKMTENERNVIIEPEDKSELRENDSDKPAEMLPHEKYQEMDSFGQNTMENEQNTEIKEEDRSETQENYTDEKLLEILQKPPEIHEELRNTDCDEIVREDPEEIVTEGENPIEEKKIENELLDNNEKIEDSLTENPVDKDLDSTLKETPVFEFHDPNIALEDEENKVENLDKDEENTETSRDTPSPIEIDSNEQKILMEDPNGAENEAQEIENSEKIDYNEPKPNEDTLLIQNTIQIEEKYENEIESENKIGNFQDSVQQEENQISKEQTEIYSHIPKKQPENELKTENHENEHFTYSGERNQEENQISEEQTESDSYDPKIQSLNEENELKTNSHKIENFAREQEETIIEQQTEIDFHDPEIQFKNDIKTENQIELDNIRDSSELKPKDSQIIEHTLDIDQKESEKEPDKINTLKTSIDEEKKFENQTEIDSQGTKPSMNTENIKELDEKSFNESYLQYKNKILNEDINITLDKLELLQNELAVTKNLDNCKDFGETYEKYNKQINEMYYLRKKESMQLIEYSPQTFLLKVTQQNILDRIDEEGEKSKIESDSKTCVLDLNLSVKQQINELIDNLDESPSLVNELRKEFSEIDPEKNSKTEVHEMKTTSSAYLITYISEPESLHGSTSVTEKKELEGLDDSILKQVAKEEILKRLEETLERNNDLEIDREFENEDKMIETEIKIENENLSRSLSPTKVEETIIEPEKSHTALGTPLSTNYNKNMARSITVSRRKSPNEKPDQQSLRKSRLSVPTKNSFGNRRISPSERQSPESENPEKLKAEESETSEKVQNETSEASNIPKRSTPPNIKTSNLMARFNVQLKRYHKEVSEFEKLKANIKNIIENLTTVHNELAGDMNEDLPQLPQDIFEKTNENEETNKHEEENKKLKESIKKKTGEIDLLKKQLYSFKEDMKTLEGKITMNEQRKSEERDKNTRLMSQFSNMKEQIEKITKEKNEIEQKKNKELEQLKTRLKGEAKKREQVELTIDENLKEISKLKSEKEDFKSEYFELSQTISEKTQKLERYKNEVKNKKIQLEDISKQVNELKETLERQNKLISELKLELDKTKNDLNSSSKRELELSGCLNQRDSMYGEILQKERNLRQKLVDFICDLSSLTEYKISPDAKYLLYEGTEIYQILNEIKNEIENYINDKNETLLRNEKTISSLKMDLKERQNLIDAFQSSEIEKNEFEIKEPPKAENTDVRSMTAKELIELMEIKKQAIEKMESELQSLHSIHTYCGMRRSFLETKITDLENLLRDYQY